jgi:hypothetical protein
LLLSSLLQGTRISALMNISGRRKVGKKVLVAALPFSAYTLVERAKTIANHIGPNVNLLIGFSLAYSIAVLYLA